jgi:hypothetical protein
LGSTLNNPALVRPAFERKPAHPVYPYSVIPGGAYSATELDAAVRSDSVVAAHYAVFDRSQLRTTRAAQSAAVYVSYRRGDQVYWTRHKVRLAAQEALLTDGVNTARARCGNRISFTPQRPTEAGEPLIDLDNAGIPPASDAPSDAYGAVDTSSLPLLVPEIFPPFLANWPVEILASGTPSVQTTNATGTGYRPPPVYFAWPGLPVVTPQSQPGTGSIAPSTSNPPITYSLLSSLPPDPGFLWMPSAPAPVGIYSSAPPTYTPPIVFVPPTTLATPPPIEWYLPIQSTVWIFPVFSGGATDPYLPGIPPAPVVIGTPVSPLGGTLSVSPVPDSPMNDVPEPGSWVLLLAGMILLGCSRALKSI